MHNIKKTIIVKAKICKCIYKIEMDVKPSYNEIINEVAKQHEVELKQIEILEIGIFADGFKKVKFETNLQGLPDFKTQYQQSQN
jgi:hypothetical protein